jgi:hypothetical protein
LAEVGELGQARISRARFEVAPGPGAEIELEYLKRAGAAAELASAAQAKPCPHAATFRFEASRSLGAGAWRALDKLRALLLDAGAP